MNEKIDSRWLHLVLLVATIVRYLCRLFLLMKIVVTLMWAIA